MDNSSIKPYDSLLNGSPLNESFTIYKDKTENYLKSNELANTHLLDPSIINQPSLDQILIHSSHNNDSSQQIDNIPQKQLTNSEENQTVENQTVENQAIENQAVENQTVENQIEQINNLSNPENDTHNIVLKNKKLKKQKKK